MTTRAASKKRTFSAIPSDGVGEDSAFLQNILDSSTEYAIIGQDLDGKILLWNEGAHRLYGYEAAEVMGKVASSFLNTPEDIQEGKQDEMMKATLHDGKWEGTITRLHKDGKSFPIRLVITPRYDRAGKPIGFLMISKNISEEIKLSEELKAIQYYARSLIEAS